jgi:putative membrane protein
MVAPHSRSSDLTCDPAQLLCESAAKQGSAQGAPTSTLYRDCAANERTFLAWIRTAIAVMAFGFVVEKFDAYRSYLDLATRAPEAASAGSGWRGPGLVLMVLGIALAISALGRFRLTDRALREHGLHLRTAGVLEILLMAALVATGLLLAIHVGQLAS